MGVGDSDPFPGLCGPEVGGCITGVANAADERRSLPFQHGGFSWLTGSPPTAARSWCAQVLGEHVPRGKAPVDVASTERVCPGRSVNNWRTMTSSRS